GKLAAKHVRIDLLNEVEYRAGDQTGRESAEMDAPVDPGIAERKRDVHSNIYCEEIGLKIDLAEYPQAQQRAQNARRRSGCADCQVGGRVDRIADDSAESQRAEIDDEKVERSDTLLEMGAPKRQAKHVGRKMHEIDVQEAVGDQPPVFVPLQRRRIHR